MEMDLTAQLTDVLRKQFHFSTFRPGQLEALLILMTRQRLLCIQPTGYGKSLLYQLPAMMLEGVTLVISPLLALMRDQLTQLQHRFGIPAVSFNTDQSYQENMAAKNALRNGKVRILFIAPEQLDYLERFNFILGLPIKLLVIDEAHCISTWGHDFRPSYRQIRHLAKALAQKTPNIRLLALTATANKKTEEDIILQLDIDTKPIIVQRESMDRPNIRLSVIPLEGTSQKLATMMDLLASLKGSGLIYCATRENTELVVEFLGTQGILTAAYHAGFETEKKRRIQNDFLQDKCQVIVATNALGMGIDKSNLRFIIHFDFPGSITAYYQETGRCGRDGQHADGILLYDPADSKIQSYFIDSGQPLVEDFDSLLTIFSNYSSSNLLALKRLSGMHTNKLNVIISELIDQGFLQKYYEHGTQHYRLTHQISKPNLTRFDTLRTLKKMELRHIQYYAEQSQYCLMMILRDGLGDAETIPCGKCARCHKVPFSVSKNEDLMLAISSWLDTRILPITLSKKAKQVTTGIAILDGKSRTEMFLQFMQQRAQDHSLALSMPDLLLQLIKDSLLSLGKRHRFGCIIPIPSRTWLAQQQIVNHLAHYLKIPALQNILFWNPLPVDRQGELLNNEQREHNVAQRMQVYPKAAIPKGTILLLDDYIGSGATMTEAARALKDHGFLKHKIVPFTIAAVKWRVGEKGIIKSSDN
jgi:ATP-dependent DNA helicase RecQ